MLEARLNELLKDKEILSIDIDYGKRDDFADGELQIRFCEIKKENIYHDLKEGQTLYNGENLIQIVLAFKPGYYLVRNVGTGKTQTYSYQELADNKYNLQNDNA